MSASTNEGELSTPNTCEDLLAQMMAGTADPLRAPDPTLGALDFWCRAAIESLDRPDYLTEAAPEPVHPDVRTALAELSTARTTERRVLLLLIVLNGNRNFQNWVGQHTPAVLFQPFLQYLHLCWLHVLRGTRMDGQSAAKLVDVEFSSIGEFVHHMRLTHLMQRLLPRDVPRRTS